MFVLTGTEGFHGIERRLSIGCRLKDYRALHIDISRVIFSCFFEKRVCVFERES